MENFFFEKFFKKLLWGRTYFNVSYLGESCIMEMKHQ